MSDNQTSFTPTGIGATIFSDRYTFHPDETYEEFAQRVGNHVGAAETDARRWSQEFTDIIRVGDFMPGGRICRGAGRPIAQLLNCFVIPTEDSREGWAKMVGDNIIIAGTGGGLGENYSNIRPRGSKINGTGGTSTGSVSIMRIENAALEEIRGGGGRRAARMMCLNVTHPDLPEFLSVKLDLKQLQGANISVFFNENPEGFFEMVRQDQEYDLVFRGAVFATVRAKEIWSKIVRNALTNGDPGILNGYLANLMSNIAYTRTLVATNPCGEQFLQPYSTCCLGALVLPRFVKDNRAKNIRDRIDWERLHNAVTLGVRFLDDVLSVTYYPTPEIKQESLDTRRIGLGIMGLHYMLLELGVAYSSEEARDFCDKLGSFIKHAAYDTSITLAAEKGSFPIWDSAKGMESGFIKSLKPSIRSKIRNFGLRNCSILTIAPTGTTGMVQGVSTGIEPIFAEAYERAYWQEDVRKTETVVDPLFKKMVLAGQDVSLFESAADISPEDHLNMQVVWQRHIDNAVSKTINIPQDKYTEEQLSDLYMKYFPKLKGITIYPEGSHPNAPLTRISREEALKLVQSKADITEMISDDCATGTCEI